MELGRLGVAPLASIIRKLLLWMLAAIVEATIESSTITEAMERSIIGMSTVMVTVAPTAMASTAVEGSEITSTKTSATRASSSSATNMAKPSTFTVVEVEVAVMEADLARVIEGVALVPGE